MKKYSLLIALQLLVNFINAQNDLAAYTDYTNHFKVFAGGMLQELEYAPVSSFKVGGNSVAYVDQKSILKIYHKGEANVYEEDAPTEIVATTNYLVYKMTQRLMIFDNGRLNKLSNAVVSYYPADSIVAWVSYPDGNFNAYENGDIKTIETAAVNRAVETVKTGSNVIAYADLANIFKVYYKSQTYSTNVNLSYIKNYACAANIVAFTDEYNNRFDVFYKGRFITLENVLPQSFNVANDMVSYVDNIGNFKLFYAGETTTLETFPPASITATNNIIVYTYANKFKVCYKGQTYTLESFIPNEPLFGINSILYTDAGGKLKFFNMGTTYDNFFFETPTAVKLYGDVALINYAVNSVGFFYKGKMY